MARCKFKERKGAVFGASAILQRAVGPRRLTPRNSLFPSAQRRFRVRRISDGRIYALKETNVRHMSHEERAEAVNEIRLQASVRHPNVTSYREAFLDGQRLCIVMEYAPYGDLQRCIRKREAHRKPFPEDLVWSYFIQVCMGIRELHRRNIIHRDIKAANILRTSPVIVKVGDLGIAKLLKGAMARTQIGTPHYMPPEVWKSRPYSFSSDVWSLGCLLYELVTLRVPFEARSLAELRFKVIRGKYNTVPRHYSKDLSRMIEMLLKTDAKNRPSLEQILAHPLVAEKMHLVPEEIRSQDNLQKSVDSAMLLDTIKVPKNIRLLKKRLPLPYYPHDRPSPEDGDTVYSLPGSLDRLNSAAPSTVASGPTASTSPEIRQKSKSRQEGLQNLKARVRQSSNSPPMRAGRAQAEPAKRQPRKRADTRNSAVSKSHSQLDSKPMGRRPSEFNRRAPRRQNRVSRSEDNLNLKKMAGRLETVSESTNSSQGSDMSYLDLHNYKKKNEVCLPPIEEHRVQRGPRVGNRKRIMAPPSEFFRC